MNLKDQLIKEFTSRIDTMRDSYLEKVKKILEIAEKKKRDLGSEKFEGDKLSLPKKRSSSPQVKNPSKIQKTSDDNKPSKSIEKKNSISRENDIQMKSLEKNESNKPINNKTDERQEKMVEDNSKSQYRDEKRPQNDQKVHERNDKKDYENYRDQRTSDQRGNYETREESYNRSYERSEKRDGQPKNERRDDDYSRGYGYYEKKSENVRSFERKEENRSMNYERKEENRSMNYERKEENRSMNYERKEENRSMNYERKEKNRSMNYERKEGNRPRNYERKEENIPKYSENKEEYIPKYSERKEENAVKYNERKVENIEKNNERNEGNTRKNYENKDEKSLKNSENIEETKKKPEPKIQAEPQKNILLPEQEKPKETPEIRTPQITFAQIENTDQSIKSALDELPFCALNRASIILNTLTNFLKASSTKTIENLAKINGEKILKDLKNKESSNELKEKYSSLLELLEKGPVEGVVEKKSDVWSILASSIQEAHSRKNEKELMGLLIKITENISGKTESYDIPHIEKTAFIIGSIAKDWRKGELKSRASLVMMRFKEKAQREGNINLDKPNSSDKQKNLIQIN